MRLHQRECSATLSDGSKMTLSISPKSIPLMKPITLMIKSENIDADKLEVKIYATNMNMGFHEFNLKKVDKISIKEV